MMAESEERKETISKETDKRTEDEDESSNRTDTSDVGVFKLPSLSSTGICKTTKPTESSSLGRGVSSVGQVKTDQPAIVESNSEKEMSVVADLSYKEPAWSGLPTRPYNFEVLKSGVVVGSIDLTERPFTVCGRLPACHIVMEHPSISRYHAIIQYRAVAEHGDDKTSRPSGFYVYDLGSTHGSFLNKSHQLKPKCYYPLHVGHMLKFGGSSRVYLLQGPEEDQEEESPLTVTQLKQLGKSRELAAEKMKENGGEQKELDGPEENAGIDWGMGEDAFEEEVPDMAINPFALDGNSLDDSSYAEDPKKTLRGWFEREGYDLEYEIEEKGQAQFLCRIRLPLDTPSGGPLFVEASVKGKKKEAVAACALEACRTLDRRGVLRRATHESRQRKKRNWEDDDYYNSDEDTYLDRTGTVERKRRQRIQRAGKEKDRVETYDSLMEKHVQIMEKISKTEAAIGQRCKRADEMDEDDQDALDAYMKSIASGDAQLDKKEKSRLKVELRLLRDEGEKLKRLINIARPTSLPPVQLEAPKQYGLSMMSQDNFKTPIARDTSVAKEMQPQSDRPIKESETTKDYVLTISDPHKKIISCAQESTLPECDTTNPIEEGTLSSNQSEKSIVATEDIERKTVEGDAPKRQKVNRKHKDKLTKYEYDQSNPNYAMWLPPNNQSGDGKTNLNDKYGY